MGKVCCKPEDEYRLDPRHAVNIMKVTDDKYLEDNAYVTTDE